MLEADNDINTVKAIDVMTTNPKSVKPDDKAISAINIMETYKITSLVVCDDDGKVTGIIHLHRLRTSGII